MFLTDRERPQLGLTATIGNVAKWGACRLSASLPASGPSGSGYRSSALRLANGERWWIAERQVAAGSPPKLPLTFPRGLLRPDLDPARCGNHRLLDHWCVCHVAGASKLPRAVPHILRTRGDLHGALADRSMAGIGHARGFARDARFVDCCWMSRRWYSRRPRCVDRNEAAATIW